MKIIIICTSVNLYPPISLSENIQCHTKLFSITMFVSISELESSHLVVHSPHADK